MSAPVQNGARPPPWGYAQFKFGCLRRLVQNPFKTMLNAAASACEDDICVLRPSWAETEATTRFIALENHTKCE